MNEGVSAAGRQPRHLTIFTGNIAGNDFSLFIHSRLLLHHLAESMDVQYGRPAAADPGWLRQPDEPSIMRTYQPKNIELRLVRVERSQDAQARIATDFAVRTSPDRDEIRPCCRLDATARRKQERATRSFCDTKSGLVGAPPDVGYSACLDPVGTSSQLPQKAYDPPTGAIT
ncbi:hypothetical protein K3495_g4164 [Podosphaera aphanis]|nr:hypothetical protein K3495_g4164 [Podosphaera aphanis]